MPDGSKTELIGPHLQHPKRSVALLTTVPATIISEKAWITLWQEGGGFKVILWVPTDPRKIDHEAKVLAEETVAHLRNSASLLGVAQVRWKHPAEFLAERGWPLKNGGYHNNHHNN